MRMPRLACFAAFMVASTAPAYAYLDPGTGSMILQAIIGTLAVGAASVSMFWQRIKSYFSGSSPTDRASATDDDGADR